MQKQNEVLKGQVTTLSEEILVLQEEVRRKTKRGGRGKAPATTQPADPKDLEVMAAQAAQEHLRDRARVAGQKYATLYRPWPPSLPNLHRLRRERPDFADRHIQEELLNAWTLLTDEPIICDKLGYDKMIIEEVHRILLSVFI